MTKSFQIWSSLVRYYQRQKINAKALQPAILFLGVG